MKIPLSTAAAAVIALTATPATTPPTMVEQQPRIIQRGVSRSLIESISQSVNPPTAQFAVLVVNDNKYEEPARPTTPHENIIGELRQWNLLGANWDGEGAAKPKAQSIKEAVSFFRLLDNKTSLPEPMLLASGHAALYWNEGDLYADIEFLGDGRIAYFIKNDGNKHKGVLSFDSTKMPAVFPALFAA